MSFFPQLGGHINCLFFPNTDALHVVNIYSKNGKILLEDLPFHSFRRIDHDHQPKLSKSSHISLFSPNFLFHQLNRFSYCFMCAIRKLTYFGKGYWPLRVLPGALEYVPSMQNEQARAELAPMSRQMASQFLPNNRYLDLPKWVFF